MSAAAPVGLPFGVLAVCSGNVCRSPFLELLLARAFAGRSDLAASSAGTIARPRMRMTDEMVTVAQAHGISESDAREHRARRLDEAAVASAGLVLGLTREHRAAAVELHPRALRYSFTLREFARLVGDLGPAESGARTPAELIGELAALRGGSSPAAAEDDDIRDPIGLPQEIYDEVGGEIADAARVAAEALLLTREAPARAAGLSVSKSSVIASEKTGPQLSFAFRRL
ncbi:hypothetical protein GCM10022286_30470 [Gryllotalpicola daejeonensis]|uniref:Phosphotyrosine protein phosphatase I domain-containing protein n=1 Tax=Gryllotalpicola daejeonensis TaxID=993087 RepID=A0ABP7ZNK8_9MICO